MNAVLQRIGPYRLLECLGQGGMGVVYRARHEQSGRIVALKTVLVPKVGLLQGIRREIHALARLRHPGIVSIVEEGFEKGVPWYAMELVHGRSLRGHASLLRQGWHPSADTLPGEPEAAWPIDSGGRGGKTRTETGVESGQDRWTTVLEILLGGQTASEGIPQDENAAPVARALGPEALGGLLGLARQLCEVLAFLHGEGLVHRDLKPDNVLVRHDGRLVLMDFGLALQAVGSELSREALDVASAAAGTIAYMAPEQACGQLVDARADLYSLGCILYELLTGRPPFLARKPLQVLHQHLHLTPEPPSSCVEGIEPRLDALVLRLLAKQPAERMGYADDVAAALARLGAAGRHEPAPRPKAYLYRPRLFGREQPLAELQRLLARARDGETGLILVGGESGVGKTRLLLELARKAADMNLLVLAGECLPAPASSELAAQGPEQSGARSAPGLELAADPPFLADSLESARAPSLRSDRSPAQPRAAGGPLQALRKPLQALADRCRDRGAEATARLLGRRGKVLELYEPALAALPGQEAYPAAVELPAQAARHRLWRYLSQTLAALCQDQPVLLVLDDLQWADELTLGFLEHVLQAGNLAEPPATRLLIVGAYRSEEAGAAGESALQRLIDAPQALRILLDRLDEAAVEAMVSDMLSLPRAPRAFTCFLARQSEGNPFFVAEYLRTAVETGGEGRAPLLWRDDQGRWQIAEPGDRAATEQDYEALPLPRSLRELVGKRLQGLPAEALRLAKAAAVLGREVEAALLQAMLGSEDTGLFGPVQELLWRQVMEEPAPGRLRFVHDKIREVAYEQIGAELRPALHRAAAEAIEALDAAGREEHLAALGQHWELAFEARRASACYLQAARACVARYEHDRAERLYRAHLKLAGEGTPESIGARNELARKVLELRGRNAEALAEHGAALAEARHLGDRALEGQSLWELGRVHWATGHLDEALGLYERALGIAREIGSRELERSVLQNLANLLKVRGSTEEARQLYEGVLAIAREIGDRRTESIVLANLGVLHKEQGRMEQARRLEEQALGIAREIGERRNEGLVLANVATSSAREGRMDEARHLYEQALGIVREIGDRRGEGVVLGNLANCLQEQGQSGVVPLYEQALGIAREVGDRRVEANLLQDLGGLHQAQGRLGEARRHYEQGLGIAREIGDRRSEGILLTNLASVELLDTGDLERTEALAGEAERLLESVAEKLALGKAICCRGRAALARAGPPATGASPGRACLERAQTLAAEAGVGPQSELGQAVASLRRTVEAFESGQDHRLFRGHLVQDLPECVRKTVGRS